MIWLHPYQVRVRLSKTRWLYAKLKYDISCDVTYLLFFQTIEQVLKDMRILSFLSSVCIVSDIAISQRFSFAKKVNRV